MSLGNDRHPNLDWIDWLVPGDCVITGGENIKRCSLVTGESNALFPDTSATVLINVATWRRRGFCPLVPTVRTASQTRHG